MIAPTVSEVPGDIDTLPLVPALNVSALLTVIAPAVLSKIEPAPFVTDTVPVPVIASEPGALKVMLPLLEVLVIAAELVKLMLDVFRVRLEADVSVPASFSVPMPLKLHPPVQDTVTFGFIVKLLPDKLMAAELILKADEVPANVTVCPVPG